MNIRFALASKKPRLPDFEGSIPACHLFDLYRRIYLRKETGTLELSNQEVSREIAFRDGNIVLVATNQNRERLGNLLVRSGILTDTQMEHALRKARRGKRLGQILLQQGTLRKQELDRFVRLHHTELAVSALDWDHGAYAFIHKLPDRYADVFVELCTADIIIEGVRRLGDSTAIQALLGNRNWKLQLAADLSQKLKGISLTRVEGYVLSRFESATSISEICQISALGEDQTIKAILGLMFAGILEIEGHGLAQPSKEPSNPGGPGPHPEVSKPDPESRPSSRPVAPDGARKSYEEGRKLYEAGDYAAASIRLAQAVTMEQGVGQYRYYLAKSLARLAGREREAEFHFSVLRHQEPWNSEYKQAFEQCPRPFPPDDRLEKLFGAAVAELNQKQPLVVATPEEMEDFMKSSARASPSPKSFA